MSKPGTVLDVIADVYGQELCPEIVASARNITRSECERLRDAMLQWEKSFEFPVKRSGELRPFLEYMRPFSDYGQASSFYVADRIKHHLLYCHSIAMECPILNYTWNILGPGQNIEVSLSLHFAVLLNLAPLIEAGVVIFLPSQSRPYPPSGESLPAWMNRSDEFRRLLNERHGAVDGKNSFRFLREVAPVMNLSDYPPHESSTVYRRGHRPRLPRGVTLAQRRILYNAYNFISESIGLIAASGDAVDLLLRYRVEDQVLRWLISSGALHLDRSTGLETTLLHDLLGMNLPSLEGLESRDIVAIRLQEDVFESWRRDLSRALTMLHAMSREEFGSGDRVSVISRELDASARELQSKVQDKSPLSVARTAFVDFALGAVSVTGAGAISGALGAVTAAAFGGLALKGAAKFALDARSNPSSQALLSHYALFR
ncbi:hypothetical protein [Streptomyces sp. NPDC001642]|uniref:hypothetical protein n=1 Tax=Streptomyces sp. NPDC001642 TaxID=3154392 RepID=UPI003317DCCB